MNVDQWVRKAGLGSADISSWFRALDRHRAEIEVERDIYVVDLRYPSAADYVGFLANQPPSGHPVRRLFQVLDKRELRKRLCKAIFERFGVFAEIDLTGMTAKHAQFELKKGGLEAKDGLVVPLWREDAEKKILELIGKVELC